MSGKQLLSASLIFILFYISYQYIGVKFGLIRQVAVDTPVTEEIQPPEPTGLPDEQGLSSPQAEPAETTTNEVEPPVEEVPAVEPQTVVLSNDKITVTLSNEGGVIKQAVLKSFFETVKKLNKVTLASPFRDAPGEIQFLNDPTLVDRVFNVEQVNDHEVRFFTQTPGGTLSKTYRLGKSYDLAYSVEYSGLEAPVKMVLAEGLEPFSDKDVQKKGLFSFLSAGSSAPKRMEVAWSQEGKHKSKPSTKYDNSEDKPILEEENLLYWAGIKDAYFCNVFIPDMPFSNVLVRSNVLPRLGADPINVPVISIGANLSSNQPLKGTFYLGPLDESDLKSVNEKLGNLVNYGYTGKLTKWMFIALKAIHNWVGNWGWSIIILTFLIRVAMFPLTAPSIRSGYKMRQIQPKIEAIKKKYPGTDLESKQKLSQETWKLYKQEKVNPFSSCITILPQMPIFIAYFSLLRTSISLRQSGWMFWINDLSIKDPTFILPVLWGVSMYITQTMTPMPGDPSQQKMMKYMPVMMTLLFITMPSGLVLYMVTSNLFQLLQTVLFKRRYQNS